MSGWCLCAGGSESEVILYGVEILLVRGTNVSQLMAQINVMISAPRVTFEITKPMFKIYLGSLCGQFDSWKRS